ncbi:MAG: hypothetical protein HGB21_11835 [Nitrospirae bacterium]|nr:hypothetical protein [Nitrospirota bacterium]NTW66975.1 hypothetical protein [Nitrospirota bacterium]
MKLRIFSASILLFFLVLNISSAHAAWSGPKEIISGSWGSGAGHFGTRTEGGFSVVPSIEAVTTDQRVIISDPVNRKHLVFSSKGERIEESAWGDTKGPSVSAIDPLYQRDRDAVTLHSLKVGSAAYRITIVFPEGNVDVDSDRDLRTATRDAVGFIYGISAESVVRFDQSGKKTGSLSLPRAYEELVQVPGQRAPRGVYIEYGEPIIAPNGDVYLWQKSDAKYSVLKWTWQ